MTGYGIVGCGYSGGIHAENLVRLPDACLKAVFDTDEGRKKEFAATWSTEAAESLEDLCADPGVEAVIIATPNNSHVIPALCAASHGKNIFCEKPAALSLLDVETMLEASKQRGILFFAAHTTNFIRGVETAKELLEAGEIGKLLMIEAVHTNWAGPQKEVGWKQKKEVSGGHLCHHMHEIDLICQLAGLPVSVSARGKNLAHFGAGFGNEEDALMLTMELAEGGLASLVMGSAFHLGDHYVKLQGESGGILLDFKNSLGRLVNSRGEKLFLMQENEEEDEERRNGYRENKKDAGKGFGRPGMRTSSWMKTIFYKELCCFDQAVRTGRIRPEFQSMADGTAAVNCGRVLEAATRSMAENRRVELEEIRI